MAVSLANRSAGHGILAELGDTARGETQQRICVDILLVFHGLELALIFIVAATLNVLHRSVKAPTSAASDSVS